MSIGDEEFRKRLLATFRVEAHEHVTQLFSGLLSLEQSTGAEPAQQVIENVFREVHSLKGAARAVGMGEVESFCQSMENLFAELKRGSLDPSGGLLDLLHTAGRALELLLTETEAGRGQAVIEAREIALQLNRVATGEKIVPADRQDAAAPCQSVAPLAGEHVAAGTSHELSPIVKISAERLKEVLFDVEELVVEKFAASRRRGVLEESLQELELWKKEWRAIEPVFRAGVQKQERSSGNAKASSPAPDFVKLLEFVEWNRAFMESLQSRLQGLAKITLQGERAVAAKVDELQWGVKKALYLPFDSLLDAFPRLVRDLCHSLGKEVQLVVQGGEVEIDRRILDELKDPLLHLVRNCIDHGIESPADREQLKKNKRGSLTISIRQLEGSWVEVTVADDGAGVDLGRVREKAAELGVDVEALVGGEEEDISSLVFLSGLSTSPMITDLSGRGLGLAIVREKVERLGGSVTLSTRQGAGTEFRAVIPQAIVAFPGVLVRCGEFLAAFPSSAVEQVTRLPRQALTTLEGVQSVVIAGISVSHALLWDLLELVGKMKRPESSSDSIQLVVVTANGRRIAFQVDEVVGAQEVVLKPLGKQLARVRNVAGATVIGTGRVVPVLHVPDLFKSAIRQRVGAAPEPPPVAAGEGKRASILVAEDSITSRMLLKNILESAGYRVRTAVDGLDALTLARSESFDLIVTDVDMPRMSGFDLTARVRADRTLAELPVILVTSLEAREDRERGIDVGASAYIVKSDFNQGNLLETIRRFI